MQLPFIFLTSLVFLLISLLGIFASPATSDVSLDNRQDSSPPNITVQCAWPYWSLEALCKEGRKSTKLTPAICEKKCGCQGGEMGCQAHGTCRDVEVTTYCSNKSCACYGASFNSPVKKERREGSQDEVGASVEIREPLAKVYPRCEDEWPGPDLPLGVFEQGKRSRDIKLDDACIGSDGVRGCSCHDGKFARKASGTCSSKGVKHACTQQGGCNYQGKAGKREVLKNEVEITAWQMAQSLEPLKCTFYSWEYGGLCQKGPKSTTLNNEICSNHCYCSLEGETTCKSYDTCNSEDLATACFDNGCKCTDVFAEPAGSSGQQERREVSKDEVKVTARTEVSCQPPLHTLVCPNDWTPPWKGLCKKGRENSQLDSDVCSAECSCSVEGKIFCAEYGDCNGQHVSASCVENGCECIRVVDSEPAGKERHEVSKNEVKVVERQWSTPSCVEWWTAIGACSQGATDYTLNPTFCTDSCGCYEGRLVCPDYGHCSGTDVETICMQNFCGCPGSRARIVMVEGGI